MYKVLQQFRKAQNVCRKTIIERNLVVIAELSATWCKNPQGTDEWILLQTAEYSFYPDGRFAGCINATFNKAVTLPLLMCCGTTRVAQWIDLIPTLYIPQNPRRLVLIYFVYTWSFPPLASGNDELARTQREVQQRAHSRAEAVADCISEQVSARQTIDDASGKEVINQISTVAQGAHYILVVALTLALVALVVAKETFVTVNPMLKLFSAAIAAILFNRPLHCSYTDRTEDAAY